MTNTTEMPEKTTGYAPEKMFIMEEYIKTNQWTAIRYPNSIEYTRTDTIPDVAELQRQNAVLKAFARTIINENCFGNDGEVNGSSAQDQAEKCDLITPHTVTREMIDKWEKDDCYPEGDFAEGDTIYYLAEWMNNGDAKMPNQNECDHEIGMEADCETWEMRDVETIKTSTVTKWFIKQESSDTLSPNLDEQVKQFNFCPNCGAKIDWDKIKEELDESKRNAQG